MHLYVCVFSCLHGHAGICKIVPPVMCRVPAGAVLRNFKFSTRRQPLKVPRGQGNMFQAGK